jgi:exopolysaccharide production protein ExoZ
MADRIISIQYIRAFSAIAIVAFHASVHYDRPIHVGEARVAVFFIMSGFVLWLITQGRGNDPTLFLARRLARLMPLYWLVTLLLFFKEIMGWSKHTAATVHQLTLSLILIPHVNNAGQIYPVLIPGWTLVLEMFFCLLLTALLWVEDKRRLWAATLVFSGLAVLGLWLRPSGPIAATYTSLINLDFLAGLWLASVWRRVRMPRPAALGLLAVGFVGSLVRLPPGLGLGGEAITGLLSIMIVAGALGLERPGAAVIGWLERIGDSAYSIYLWHIPVQGVVWGAMDHFHVTNVSMCIALGTLAATVVGMIAYPCVEKPLTEYLFAWLDRHWSARAAARAAAASVS